LIRWAGPPLSLPYALNLWIFAREFVRHRRLGVDDRLDRFARELVERARDPTIDEIVVASHSLGAALMLDVIDRALRSDPDMARRDQLCVLTPGSSLLQVGLHPAAGGLRAAVGRVANHPIVYWVDYQALIDPVNFYKADPVVAMGLPAAKNPIIRIVRISRMVADATYRRMRGDFLRLHRQFVMGNERRYRYDFFMICCGPMSLRARVEYPDRAVGAFAPDGAYAGLAADEMLK
jgi:hypothetical protein